MIPHPRPRLRAPRHLLALAGLLASATALAYPPTPHHVYSGMVRNAWGEPLNVANASVFVVSTNSVGAQASIAPTVWPGVNYVLQVPLDAGLTPEPYTPAALRPAQPLQLKVRIGSTTYLPLEMALGPAPVGHPGGATRLDLTLGEDTDGDDLPDAWEQTIIAVLGGTLASIHPDGDSDGDGISNRHEYLAGTYAFDAADGFILSLVAADDTQSTLEFLAIRGRTYSLRASTDLHEWTPVPFRIAGSPTATELVSRYRALDVRTLRVSVPHPDGVPHRYFKATIE